jgi:hypothetical protein
VSGAKNGLLNAEASANNAMDESPVLAWLFPRGGDGPKPALAGVPSGRTTTPTPVDSTPEVAQPMRMDIDGTEGGVTPTPQGRVAPQNENKVPQVQPPKQPKITAPNKSDLDKYRAELKVGHRNTVAVGKTDVEGLEGFTFKGASPEVRKEAGLPTLDDIAPLREIKSPAVSPRGRNHAEEGVIAEFVHAVDSAKLQPHQIKGTLRIHQSNPRGFCTTCIQGINNPNVPEGILLQLSRKYPNLVIKGSSETIEGMKASGRHSFTLKNGQHLRD